MMDQWLVILILGMLALMGWVFQILATSRQQSARLRSEERLRLLERFQTGEELAAFLQTPAGERLLKTLDTPTHPVRILARGTEMGIIFLFFGLGFMTMSFVGGEEDGLATGLLMLLLGVGVLVAVRVSAILYRRAGLLTRAATDERPQA